MMLFWRGGGGCTIYVLYRCGVPSFSCGCYCSSLLLVCSVEEQLVFFPRLLVRGMTSPLTDVVVEKPRLSQKGDPFGHHHVIRDGLYSCSRKFSPLLQLFFQLGKGFCGVVGPHNIHCILLKVNLVYHHDPTPVLQIHGASPALR